MIEDYVDITVTDTVNTINITPSITDEIIDINIADNRDDVIINVTDSIIEVNINKITGILYNVWGAITGTLSDQTDLQSALNLKVPTSRTLTINGTALDLSANRSWSVGTVTNVTANSPLSSSGGATPAISIQVANTSQNGYLSSTDWNTFNNKASALSGTINTLTYWASATTIGSLALASYPSLTEISYVKGVTSAIQTQLNTKIGGSGTANYIAKFNGSSTTLGNSIIYDNGTNIGIGTSSPVAKLHLSNGTQSLVFSPDTATNGPYIQSYNYSSSAYLPLDYISYSHHFNTSGSEKMRISNAGAISMGTTGSYGGRLTLISSSNPTSASDSKNQISIGEASSNNSYNLKIGYINLGANYYGSLQVISGGVASNLLLNADGGNVGIGTTTPTSKLHVNGIVEYATNALAIAGGLTAGAFYHTAGVLKVVI